RAARWTLNLPYHLATMTSVSDGNRVAHRAVRRGTEDAECESVYASVGAPFAAVSGSLEYFLTERYCLYHRTRRGRPYRLDIHHRPWPLQRAEGAFRRNSIPAASGLDLRGEPVLLHFAKRLDVVTWAPTFL
ncbi:MAG TPA: DUF2071 domain-containing protein, partial [Gemmatimonadaceae bacterium]|nr:DUF2071 domain-containing protein [Gemmatimonadaceae bacterium]